MIKTDKNSSKRRQENKVDRPIFIVGCGRSGSTLLYNMLCIHADLAWFSNFTTRFTRLSFLASFSRLYHLRLRNNFPKRLMKAIPKPSEGYELWDLARPVLNSPSDPPLTHAEANSDDITRIEAIILNHLKYQKGVRFINKNTRNTRRIGYLNALFPDARFIHIVRDPRASVASLIKVAWWPELKIWNHNSVTPANWVELGKDPVILAAELWRDETHLVLDHTQVLSKRYFRVCYEDLTTNPRETLDQILEFCDLSSNERFTERLEMFKVKNMNFKYKDDLSPEQQELIEEITIPTLEEMGYENI